MVNPSDSEERLYDGTPFVCVSVRLINSTTGSWHDIVGKYSHEILVTSYRLLYMLPVTWSWLEMMSLFFVVFKEWQTCSRLCLGKIMIAKRPQCRWYFTEVLLCCRLPPVWDHMHTFCNEIVQQINKSRWLKYGHFNSNLSTLFTSPLTICQTARTCILLRDLSPRVYCL